MSCLKRCYLTVESSNVFSCSRPDPGPAAGTDAGEGAAAFQVLSAVLRSHIKRPTLRRVRFKLPLVAGLHSANLPRLARVDRVSR